MGLTAAPPPTWGPRCRGPRLVGRGDVPGGGRGHSLLVMQCSAGRRRFLRRPCSTERTDGRCTSCSTKRWDCGGRSRSGAAARGACPALGAPRAAGRPSPPGEPLVQPSPGRTPAPESPLPVPGLQHPCDPPGPARAGAAHLSPAASLRPALSGAPVTPSKALGTASLQDSRASSWEDRLRGLLARDQHERPVEVSGPRQKAGRPLETVGPGEQTGLERAGSSGPRRGSLALRGHSRSSRL